MRCMLLSVALVLASWPISAAVQITLFTGDTLLGRCEELLGNQEQLANRADGRYCLGLVKGVSWTFESFRVRGEHPDLTVCIPPMAPTLQHVRVVVEYLNEHPSDLHLSDVALVEWALREAYPCH